MSTGNIIFWVVIIAIGAYIYLRRKNKIPKLFGSSTYGRGGSVIDENNIVEEWSQLLVGMGGKGEELLKSIARKIQEINLPDITLLRKEASLGRSNATLGDKRYEFISLRQHHYPDYELWIGAIDRAGQLKASWYLTVALPGRVTGTLRAMNKASRDSMPRPMRAFSMLPRTLGRMMAQRRNEKATGKPAPIRVRPEDMTLDDKEEFGTYISLIPQAVLGGLEEVMNNLNLDFSKVDKHTEGFLNLS